MNLIVGIPACNVDVRGHPQHAQLTLQSLW